MGVDALATACGHPLYVKEWSQIGKANQPSNPHFWSNAAWNAGRAGVAAGTLGVSEMTAATWVYWQTGDADTYQQTMGELAAANLVAAGSAAATRAVTARFARYKGYGYRVMTSEEYAGASRGQWADSHYVLGDSTQMGAKWLWTTEDAAAKWQIFVQQNGEEGLITIVRTKRPLGAYEYYPHPPEGTAVHVPIEHLGPATTNLTPPPPPGKSVPVPLWMFRGPGDRREPPQ